MEILRFPGAVARAAKVASRCSPDGGGDVIAADRLDKLNRWRAAGLNGFILDEATHAAGVLFLCDRSGDTW